MHFTEKELKKHSTHNILEVFAPAYNEDYYDFTDLVSSILNSNKSFCMVELGAGYGRWLVHGANACKLLNVELGSLIGCEAEPTHYKWMRQHFLDNGLDPAEHKLIEGVVSNQNGYLPFYVGKPDSWYGQSIAQNVIDYGAPVESFFEKIKRKILRKHNATPSFINVPCYTLESILENVDFVDFMHVDIQGAEFDVLSASIDILNQKVKKVHIGTHSPDVEPAKGRDMDALIYELFEIHKWNNITRIAPLSENEYDGNRIRFVDGVQTWSNPRL